MSEFLTAEAIQNLFRDLGAMLQKSENNSARILILEARQGDNKEKYHSIELRLNRIENEAGTISVIKERLEVANDEIRALKVIAEHDDKGRDRKNRIWVALTGALGGAIVTGIVTLLTHIL